MLGINGAQLADGSLKNRAFAYATIQAMRPGRRNDTAHFDGGASLLHMGISIFGRRSLRLALDGREQLCEQQPGSVYIGNMCAVLHQVMHRPAEDQDGCLFRAPGSHEPLLFTVMVRSDLFSRDRARTIKSAPNPRAVYSIVNDVVAGHIAQEPFLLPDFATVVRDYDHASETPVHRVGSRLLQLPRKRPAASKTENQDS